MKKCPYCGHEMADDANRCEKCCVGFPTDEKQEIKQETEQKPVPKRKIRS